MKRFALLLALSAVAAACGAGRRADDGGGTTGKDAGITTDAGHDAGSVAPPDAGTPGDDGGGAGGADKGAPQILSLSASPSTLSAGGSVVVSAVVGDPDGLGDLAGGTLTDDASAQVLGAFGTPGGQGTFTFTVTWTALNDAAPIDGPPGGTTRALTATFFDNHGQRTEQTLSLGLRCPPNAGGTALCSGTCVDLDTDARNCGACRTPVPSGTSCVGGRPTSCEPGLQLCSAGCTDTTSDSANCGRCGRDCTAWAQSHGASVCSDVDGGTCQSDSIAICDSTGGGSCQVQLTTTSRVSCDSLCQALGLRCRPVQVNGGCNGACSYYDTPSSFQCVETTACGSTPSATHACDGTTGAFSSLRCACGE